jgi:hypothetical protein
LQAAGAPARAPAAQPLQQQGRLLGQPRWPPLLRPLLLLPTLSTWGLLWQLLLWLGQQPLLLQLQLLRAQPVAHALMMQQQALPAARMGRAEGWQRRGMLGSSQKSPVMGAQRQLLLQLVRAASPAPHPRQKAHEQQQQQHGKQQEVKQRKHLEPRLMQTGMKHSRTC